jgi:peptidoglycan/xylan/chitin deacetylase (PgdA/CDA1 family)
MGRTEGALQRIVGVKPAFMRPPFGSYNNLVRRVAAARGQTLAIWDFDSGDTTGSTAEQSNVAYDQVAKEHPLNILTINHETKGV